MKDRGNFYSNLERERNSGSSTLREEYSAMMGWPEHYTLLLLAFGGIAFAEIGLSAFFLDESLDCDIYNKFSLCFRHVQRVDQSYADDHTNF